MEMNSSRNDFAGGPFEDLYIYYLKGRLASDADLRGPDYIGNWEENGYSFLFYTRSCTDRIDKVLSHQPQVSLIDAYHMAYDEWLGERPTTFTAGRFIIAPPWEKSPAKSRRERGSLPLILDPGVVFGTGTHTTTNDCLRAIESRFATETFPQTVIDLGTGTGVLALAAAALGASKVLAVDINFLAARTAARNARLNRMGDRILSIQGRAESYVELPADLMIANIHYDAMRLLLKSAGFRQKKSFVISGLLRSQSGAVADLLLKSGAEILNHWEGDGIWHTLLGTNPGAHR